MNKLRCFMPIGFLAVAAGFGAVVMLLWNWLMPSLFGVMTVSFWQALGLLILCRILVGSLGGWNWHRRMHNKHVRGLDGVHHLREKWQKMTPEQRKEFVNKRRECGFCNRPNFDTFATDENPPKEHE